MKSYLQKIGRSLMLPVAVLPLAALMLGIGYAIDPAGWGGESAIAAFLVKGGEAILDNLGILFAVGVAIGLAEDRDGAAGLAGLVGFLTVNTLLQPDAVAQLTRVDVESVNVAFSSIEFGNVFIGILTGVIAGELYNKFHKTRVPSAFAFFGGRRLVPIVTGITMLVVALILLFVWPPVYNGLVSFGEFISGLGWIGAGIYAFFNRLLIPTGLHHALNNVFWFDLVGINDIGNFWASEGVKGVTGMYQAGFFPVFMFGLPAAGFAMYQQADEKNKPQVLSLMLAGAITAFTTGVTEPLEFSFMFVAPQLYLVHALLTGLSVAFSAFMNWTAGFAFSAGAIDFGLSLSVPIANQPWMLMVQGIVVGIIYYVVFTAMIKGLNLPTPGRLSPVGDVDTGVADSVSSESPIAVKTTGTAETKEERQAQVIYEALGGNENIESVTNCATRLRLGLKDTKAVDLDKIKGTGVPGVNVVSDRDLQVIVGTNVQFVADALEDIVKKNQ